MMRRMPSDSHHRTSWRRRVQRLARKLGISIAGVGPGAVLVSRSSGHEVRTLTPGQAYLVRRGGKGTTAAIARKAHGELLAHEQRTMKQLSAAHLAWLLARYRVDVVLDVGANVGQFAQELREHGYAGHIMSFEPVPRFVNKLKTLATDDDRWTVRQLALGTAAGSVPMRVQHSLSSILEATEYGRGRFRSLEKFADTARVDVPLQRLDAIYDEVLAPVIAAGVERPRVFLKMDTQGFDLEVFRGLGERVGEIVGLQSEVALLTIYEGMPRMPEAVALYEAAGFEISGLFPVTREPDGRVIEYDCVMVRASACPPVTR